MLTVDMLFLPPTLKELAIIASSIWVFFYSNSKGLSFFFFFFFFSFKRLGLLGLLGFGDFGASTTLLSAHSPEFAFAPKKCCEILESR